MNKMTVDDEDVIAAAEEVLLTCNIGPDQQVVFWTREQLKQIIIASIAMGGTAIIEERENEQRTSNNNVN